MKNFFKSMMLVAVAAMGFAACSTENTNDPAVEFEPNMVEMSIIAEQTRTVLDSSEAFANWEASDKIAVFEVADAISITESTETILNDGLASFRFSFTENTTASSFDYYAVYPYANVIDKNSDDYKTATMGKIKLNTPATQNPKATSFDGGADLLLSRPVTDLTAQPSEAMSMAFTRVVALAKMTLKNLNTTDPIINVTFTAPNKVLAGRSYFDLTTSQVYTDDEGDGYGYYGATNTITLNYNPSLVNVAAGTPIYFTTLPTELVADDKFTVTVSTENKKFTKEVTIPEGRNIAFVAGDMASFSVNMSEATVETIEDFTGEYAVAALGTSNKGLQLMSNANGNVLANVTVDANATAIPDSYTYTDESLVWIVENGANAGEYYIKQKSSGKYVYAVSNNNYAKLGDTPEALTIVKEDNGSHTITSSKSTGSRVLRYNASSPRFAFYASGQTVIYLIPAVESVNPLIEVNEQPAQVSYEGAEVTVNLTTANLTEAITATTEAEWITDATVTDNVLTFTVVANDVEEEREATIILSADDVTATVTVTQAGKPAEGEPVEAWVLLTDISNLAVGDEIIIANTKDKVAMSTNQKSNNRGATSITINGNEATPSADTQIITVEAGTTSGTYAFNVGGGYLYAASSSGNQLKTQTSSNNANGSWKITITNAGVASVIAQGSNSRNVMQYNPNNGSPIFACYSSASQQALSLYKRTTTGGGTDEPETPVTPTQLATPTNVKATNVDGLSVTLTWDEVDGAGSYDVTYGETTTNVATNSATLTMDAYSTTYSFTVTAIPAEDDTTHTASDASAAVEVKTGDDPNAGGGEGVTVTLTNSEIAAAKTSSTSYRTLSISSESGTWTGHGIVNKSGTSTYLQINSPNTSSRKGCHVKSPEFNGKVSQIVVYTNNSTSSGRIIYICSADYDSENAKTSAPSGTDILAQGKSTQAAGTITIDVTTLELSQFKMYTNGACYIDHIEVTYQ